MEREIYLSGYCRQLDAARMVEVILENGKLSDVDCGFERCPFTSVCPIAAEIEQMK